MRTLTTLCALGALSLPGGRRTDDRAVSAPRGRLRRRRRLRAGNGRAEALRLCTPRDLPFAVSDKRFWHTCVRATIAKAVKRVGAPLLTAIHSERGGR